MRPVRAGIVGAGFAGRAHLDALRRVPDVEIVALAASSPERSEEAAASLGVPQAFASAETLVSSADVDVIHNCTPNVLHAPLNRLVLEAGKHLLSEKPLGLTSRETGALQELADSGQSVTGVCHNYRHYPLVRHMKAVLDSGSHGRPHFVYGTYLQDWLLFESDWNWRLEVEQAGRSRAFADIGSHWLDLMQYVTGARVTRVCARLARLHERRRRPDVTTQTFGSVSSDPEGRSVDIDTEDFGSVLLELDSGATGALSVSQVSPGRKNHLTLSIDTPELGLGWDQEEPNRLWLGRRTAANSTLFRDPSLLSAPAAGLAHYPAGHEEGWPDALRNLVADFYAAVRAHGDGTPYECSVATFEDAHHVTRIVEAILESDARRSWVRVSEG